MGQAHTAASSYFGQAVYGEQAYSSSYYSSNEPGGSMVNTGTPLYFGSVVGISIIAAALVVVAKTAWRQRRTSNR